MVFFKNNEKIHTRRAFGQLLEMLYLVTQFLKEYDNY